VATLKLVRRGGIVELEVLVTLGLGDNSYLIASEGEAALIDPQRDPGRYPALAESKGVAIRHVLETHVHNDYVSGALEVRAATGAEVVAPAAGRYEFPFHPISEGDEVRVGDLRLRALETPGHTPEHVAYSVYEGSGEVPSAVFTGGSLMVGGAGRTDLLGPALTDSLTRDQFRTLRRLAALPDDTLVLPTHGAGSFCGAGPAPKERTSTIREERGRNNALATIDEEAFVRQQTSGLLAFPAYYRYMAPINRAGPRLLKDLPKPGPLTPEETVAVVEAGATIVDGRWRGAFARAHIPGSVNVELADSFGSYVGWLVPFDQPVVLVLPEPEGDALGEAVVQLHRVGYERLDGFLQGGIERWRATGRPVRSYRVSGLEQMCRAYQAGRVTRILDVRQGTEWDKGHIPGSTHVFVGDLPDRVGEILKAR